mgnify:CR=1 FL=1|jgi:Zn-dependent protease
MELLSILIVVVILLVSIVIHEIAHGATAYWLGDDTAKVAGRLTLNPLAHIEPTISIIMPLVCIIAGLPVIGGAKPVPVNTRKINGGEWGMALVALAGPLSNFLLALIGYGIFSLLNISSGLFGSILVLFVKINLGLMLFNLLPIPPLDGSKIIYPIAPEFVQDIIEKLEKNSWLVFVIILLFTAQISAVIGMVQSWILSFFVAIF